MTFGQIRSIHEKPAQQLFSGIQLNSTELQVSNSIRSNLSNLQIDVGISLLDGYLNPDSAASNAGNNAILLGSLQSVGQLHLSYCACCQGNLSKLAIALLVTHWYLPNLALKR